MRKTSRTMAVLDEYTAMPRTRFQGSKRKLAHWITESLVEVPFATVLDAFGGTGSVAFAFKRLGKQVTYNDALQFNYWVGAALIENDSEQLPDDIVAQLSARKADRAYDDVVERHFADIYFTDAENRWLDVVAQNIAAIHNRRRRAMAYYALFQSALAKRPYNLFHRKNLYMRKAEVSRTFGNKVTWDRPFDVHLKHFVNEINGCVFGNGTSCRALNLNACDVPGDFDLVYIDPPYVNTRGVGVDYHHFYHFLEGLVNYAEWEDGIDFDSKHRRLHAVASPWVSGSTINEAFERVFQRYADSILAVSYRSDGIPSIDELQSMLRRFKRRVRVVEYARYQYALSTNKRSREILLIGE